MSRISTWISVIEVGRNLVGDAGAASLASALERNVALQAIKLEDNSTSNANSRNRAAVTAGS